MTNDILKSAGIALGSSGRDYLTDLRLPTSLPDPKMGNHISDMLRMADRHNELMRAAIGPFEQWKSLGAFRPDSALQREMERMRHLTADMDAHYRLPQMLEVARLSGQLSERNLQAYLCGANEYSAIQRATDAMRSPWLLGHDPLRSFGAFTELQNIGRAVSAMPTFGKEFTAALRNDLGDWRDRIIWPDAIFSDVHARGEFYAERGFNDALTDFPAAAFHQSLEIAGLRRQLPAALARYSASIPRPDSSEEIEDEEFVRTKEAYDRLLRFESRLRKFIDKTMAAEFGSDWPRHRLPNGLYEKWVEKQRSDEQGQRRAWPLIAYADFTDYERIICKNDNWREIFSRTFGRPDSVRESFQRLYPIRLCTMHARLITQEDELLLLVEVQRLIRAIQ